jgi:hypothetical protein
LIDCPRVQKPDEHDSRDAFAATQVGDLDYSPAFGGYSRPVFLVFGHLEEFK